MNGFDEFTGLFPVNKTIRWELRPVGQTAKIMEQEGFLERDRSRKDSYKVVKGLADECYRRFIDENLETLELDWDKLAGAMGAFQRTKEQKERKELNKMKDEMRNAISSHFCKDVRSKSLFEADILTRYIPEMDLSEGEKDSLKEFDRFAGYFQDFFKNRENIIKTARGSCAYRIVDDNFPRHFENCRKYESIRRDYPEIIKELRESMKGFTDPDILFSINNYNRLVRQKDIDEYNTVLGSVFLSEKDVHKGLNPILNEFHQKNPDTRRVIMQKLQKQILSVSESGSFKIPQFENADQMMAAIHTFWTDMDTKGVFREPYEVLRNGGYDKENVYIKDIGVRTLSQMMFSDWEHIGGLLQLYKISNLGASASKSRTKIEKWLSSKEFSLAVLDASISDETEYDVASFIADRMEHAAKDAAQTFDDIKRGESSEREEMNRRVKAFVDSIIKYRDLVNLLSYDSDLPLDCNLYDTMRFASDELVSAVRLYNMCRNFITKKDYSTEKFRMNFDCGHLADGWDISKESDYNSFIFRRGGKYYVGIRNPKWKFKDHFLFIDSPECSDFYEKMVYKQLQDPMKMLPKVMFSKKGINKYNPPQNILDKYRSGMHRQGESFDLGFCHELIDFYKEAISKNPDWNIFGFKFRNTEDYRSIAEFYQDVQFQGYTIKFVKVPKETIDSMVNEGKLFLFQMYNKDYSDNKKSGGMPNLHTMYWEAAMSDDNISDVCIKLSGFAELFWRDKSVEVPVVHHKGSVLVNRTGFDGKSIPDDVYYELCRYRNGIIKELSPRAKAYEQCVVTKTAQYDIEKNRRYCYDRMFIHVPLMFNFKTDGKADVNRKVIDLLRSDENIKFLGIDRGERNLLYLSLIDSNGRIIWQRSLNTIVQKVGNGSERLVDYYGKLRQREIERRESRLNWKPINNIKSLKEGYIAAAVHEICRIAVEENAIIVMEDLNYGFKNSRKKVERQTYQTFERMLIEKLQLLAFKDREFRVPGGVLNPYQLCCQVSSLEDIPRHCGIIFHVLASYTSRIDPTTGFINAFNLSAITNNRLRSDFLGKMKSIRYNAAEDVFEFEFDYKDFPTRVSMQRTRWTVCTFGVRYSYSKKDRTRYAVSPTGMIKSVLDRSGVEYTNGLDIREAVISSDAVADVFHALELTLDMRVTDGDTDIIESPVRGSDGTHFITGGRPDMPVDADANGAYCIAMKGLLLARTLRESDEDKLPLLNNASWLKFMEK